MDRSELRVLLVTSSPIIKSFFAQLSTGKDEPFVIDYLPITLSTSTLQELPAVLATASVAVVEMAPWPDLTAAIDFCEAMHTQHPTLPIVVLVHGPRDVSLWHVRRLFVGEISGLLDLHATMDEVRLALRSVLGGAIVVRLQRDSEHNAHLQTALASGSNSNLVPLARKERFPSLSPATIAPSLSLTARERQVLDLIAQAMPDKEIAMRLGMQPTTVETHVQRIYAKLNVHSRFQLGAAVAQSGLVRNG